MYYEQVPNRKAFVSYEASDRPYVDAFVKRWTENEKVFIPKMVGVGGYEQDIINSNNTEYVMGQLRTRYIGDSTMTILLIGSCTHSRRYVDWELKATLRQGETYTPNGLIGILLSEYDFGPQNLPYLPDRFAANVSSNGDGYARYYYPPTSATELRSWIEDAYAARTARAKLIQNNADRMLYNAKCRVCGVTH
jgi:hypothetical protein